VRKILKIFKNKNYSKSKISPNLRSKKSHSPRAFQQYQELAPIILILIFKKPLIKLFNIQQHCKFKPMLCEYVVFYMSWGIYIYIYIYIYQFIYPLDKDILKLKIFYQIRVQM